MPNPNPRVDHLKKYEFQPGNPGGGRPRKRPMSEAADDRVRAPLEPKYKHRFQEAGLVVPREATVADGIILALSIKALAGDVAAAKELREQIEGKSKIRVEVEDTTKRTPRLVVVFEGKPTDPLAPKEPAQLTEEQKPAIDVAVEQAVLDEVIDDGDHN